MCEFFDFVETVDSDNQINKVMMIKESDEGMKYIESVLTDELRRLLSIDCDKFDAETCFKQFESKVELDFYENYTFHKESLLQNYEHVDFENRADKQFFVGTNDEYEIFVGFLFKSDEDFYIETE